jgi:hypothetical protein
VPPGALRPRTVTELIDASVQLLRRHYLELVTTAAIFTIPLIILRLFTNPVTPGQLPTGGQLESLLVILLVSFVLGSMSGAASVVIVSDSYLGRDVTISAAIQRVMERFGSVLLAALLYGFFVAIGFILFFIPGFIAFAWFFAAQNVVMIEGKGALDALARSKDLARGSVGRILGTLFLSLLILIIIQGVIGGLLGAVFSPLRGNSTPAAVVSSVVGIFVFPFFSVLVTLLYYDLRIRKEGFDLELMAKELGAPAPAPA